MPFNVLRCYQCRTFQVHPQIKASKWRCKMCNERQSFLKIYMTGTAQECRQTVQTLNMRQGEAECEVEQTVTNSPSRNVLFGFHSDVLESGEQLHSIDRVEEHARILSTRPEGAANRVVKDFDKTATTTNSTRLNPQTGRQSHGFLTASNYQGTDTNRSKWSKYLEPAELADSSSEEVDTPTLSSVHCGFRSSHYGVASTHPTCLGAEKAESSSEDENIVPFLSSKYPTVYPM